MFHLDLPQVGLSSFQASGGSFLRREAADRATKSWEVDFSSRAIFIRRRTFLKVYVSSNFQTSRSQSWNTYKKLAITQTMSCLTYYFWKFEYRMKHFDSCLISDSLWIVILPRFCFFQGAKKLCPQCNMITSPSDLRRIYLWSVNNPYKSWILAQSGNGYRHSTKCTGWQIHLWSSARPHSCQSIKRKLQARLNALDMSSLQVYVAAYRWNDVQTIVNNPWHKITE